MTSFLAWVYAQANKVYDWFGSTYYTLKHAAASAWNWAVEQAANAYNAAVNYAYHLLQTVQSGITSSIDWLLGKIADVRNSLLEDISGLFDWVEYKFNSIRDLVVNIVNDILGGLWGLIDDARNFASLLFDNLLAWVVTWVMDNFGWVLNVRDAIFNLLEIFNPSTWNDVIEMLSGWKNTVLKFIENPIDFIFGVIQDKILAFLDYVIGWALGTIKYDLPAGRTWKDN
jgi:phage-related protein